MVCHCQECDDYLCSECRKAHNRTRMTRAHTIREVRATVLRHHRKDAAKGGLVREIGEPGSSETQDEPGNPKILADAPGRLTISLCLLNSALIIMYEVQKVGRCYHQMSRRPTPAQATARLTSGG